MEYRVEITRRVERDLTYIDGKIEALESRAAAKWFNALERAIFGLTRLPRRCPHAPESQAAKRQLRHLLFGSRPYVYRVIYEIDETSKTVYILTIRHGFMDKASASELAQ